MYKYTENNLLENPETYFYSKFMGLPFLKSYFLKRREKLLEFKNKLPDDYISNNLENITISKLKENCKSKKSNLSINTFHFLLKKLNEKRIIDNDIILNRIIQKFEVSKKINDLYSIDELKPIGNNKNIDIYILFGVLLINFYKMNKKLKYLNSILKLSDILCSLPNNTSFSFVYGSALIIENELNFVEEILSKNKINL